MSEEKIWSNHLLCATNAAYRARRDTDPEQCVIQDGPSYKPIVRRKQHPPK